MITQEQKNAQRKRTKKENTQNENAKNEDAKDKRNKKGTVKKINNRNSILIIFLLFALVFISLGTIYLIKDKDKKEPVTTEEPTTEKIIIKDFVGIKDTTFTANIDKYYSYGTSLCIDGSFTNSEFGETSTASLVLRQAYTFEDGSINETDLFEFPLIVSTDENHITFSSYEHINTGIDLEKITLGEYCMLLKITTNNVTTYGTLSAQGENDAFTYYSITKNGTNNKIDLSFETFENTAYTSVNCVASTLPDDVYDIVIDPGHGGNDPGAINGDYNERVMMLDYAIDLKAALEAKGFKVLLTRDGSEGDDVWMAYTMYDEDGRVNVASASKAKICLSLHLNSNEVALSQGGLQIYFSCRANQASAEIFAKNIINSSGTYPSPMSSFKVADGLYTRAFSAGDMADSRNYAIEKGMVPYDVAPNTDFYFMIRELGGVATGAYIDGRNPDYGTNLYRDSLNGVESFILELGFISVDSDLNHLIENKAQYVEGIVKGLLESLQ